MLNKSIHTIVTHPGRFHADEIYAIALSKIVLEKGRLNIRRTRNVQGGALEDPRVLVIDVGSRYDPNKSNFDHHQNPDLPASNILVLNAADPWYKEHLKRTLFDQISDVDLGRVIHKRGEHYGINQIIRSFNHWPDDTGFEKAIQVAIDTLGGIIGEAAAFRPLDDKYQKLPRHLSGRVVELEGYFPAGWEPPFVEDGVKLLLSGKEQSWQLTVRKTPSGQLVIPEKSATQKFRHTTGFMATYRSRQDALAHAEMIVNES